jgi:porin
MYSEAFFFALLSGIISFYLSPVQAQVEIDNQEPVVLKLSYVGDNVNNLSGGIKSGSCFLGMANIRLAFDFEKAGLWKGGQFYISLSNTHGSSPSSNLLGDMQIASNIDAGNHTYLQELWFRQSFGRVEFTLGLQDLNLEFANSEHGSLFLNSSFGILPTISNNISAPIFPLTTLGFTVKWDISEKVSWINAVYDGSPTDFDYNPYNVIWQFNTGDGLLAISEFQVRTGHKELSGTFKAGFYSHNHLLEESFFEKLPDSLNNHLFGIYTNADQKIWIQNNKSIGLFAQLGYSPSDACTNDFYFGLGVNYTGLFSKKGSDVLGLAIAHECFRARSYSETIIELTWKYQLTRKISIQPDLQYIINPAGTGRPLNNSLAGNFRLGINI